MRSQQVWSVEIPKPQDPNTTLTNQVKGVAFSNDGRCCIAVVGDAILAYDSDSGQLINKTIRGAHKDTINGVAFSKDGKRFATCGADKTVVIFKFSPEEDPIISAELKYQHTDDVQCLSFNPLTGQIFSAGNQDYALWTPDQGNIEKQKTKQKIICCQWASDGMTIAYGTMQGMIVLKDRQLQLKIEIQRSQPIWCMDWTPITPDNLSSILFVGCWDQTITMYNPTGQQIGTHRQLDYNPLSLQFFGNGEFYIISGTHKKVSLYAKEGGFLKDVSDNEDWVWCAKLRNKEMYVATACNNGQIKQFKLTPLSVHSLYQDRYASREGLTDVIIQSIQSNNKIRLKCKELVRKVSIYKDKVAALLNDRILIYVQEQDKQNIHDETFKYKLSKKINKRVECTHFEILASHILVTQKKKIQLLKFNGELEREWILNSTIKFLKNTGGPVKQENILVGLKSGQVCQIMVNNSFPVILQEHQIPIVQCDLSVNRKRLAIVDKNKNLTIYDLISKEVIQTEMHVTSCAFNNFFNDSIAYSGQDILYIKTGSNAPLTQRYQGKIVGFKGNKLFVLDDNNLNSIEVSQTNSILSFIEKQDFKSAYQLACLGSTTQDFKLLGLEALDKQNFEIAMKCFLRTNDIEYVEFIRKQQNLIQNNQFVVKNFQAELLSYQQKFHEASKIYQQQQNIDDFIKLWVGLNKAQTAINYINDVYGRRTSDGNQNSSGAQIVNRIKQEEALLIEKLGNQEDASKLFTEIGEYKKSIQIHIKKQNMDGLIEVCRLLDKDKHHQELQQCAFQFRKNKKPQYAKEAYLKLGDQKSLIALYIENEQFEDALLLGKQDPQLLEQVKLPYAHWLSRNDRFQEALIAFKQLNRHDLTTKMLYQLSKNSVEENRFDSASTYFWILATQCLQLVSNAAQPVGEDNDYLQKFDDYNRKAEIYHAYSKVHSYIEEPIQPLSGIAFLLNIFNSAKFVINKLQGESLYGVKQSYLYYALGKVSKQLEGYKTARQSYEKLQFYKINADWQEEIDLSNLLIRSKPFSDKDSLLPICNRCLNSNSVISNNGNICNTCQHQFICSFQSFETLPLVEFKVDSRISHQQVIQLLYSDKSKLPKYKKKIVQDDGWSESTVNQQSLNLQNNPEREQGSLFLDKLNEVQEMQSNTQEIVPLVLDERILQTLEPDEVYWINYKKFCPTMEIKYYKCMVPDVALHSCQECCKFFFLDEFEFEYIKNKKCPFCKTLDEREGPQKDVFDI